MEEMEDKIRNVHSLERNKTRYLMEGRGPSGKTLAWDSGTEGGQSTEQRSHVSRPFVVSFDDGERKLPGPERLTRGHR